MEDPPSAPGAPPELLILHAAEAEEWASYLRRILKFSGKFHERSIWLQALDPATGPRGGAVERLRSGGGGAAVVLLLTGALLDLLRDPGPLGALLRPPRPVVALLCGVTEDAVPTERLEGWPAWRKLHSHDEPALYVDAILESVTEDDWRPNRRRPRPLKIPPRVKQVEQVEQMEKVEQVEQMEKVERVEQMEKVEQVEQMEKVEQVEKVERLCVRLTPVTFYTSMGEVSRLLGEAAHPVDFLCQAFNLTRGATEALDRMLAASLTASMPAGGLQLFGVGQIEEDNMAAYQRGEELPTLLHFSAKYGLKQLTAVLLRCPGALQAYSVMNRAGDYPNTLAQKSGFSQLRQFMDEFAETADMLKSHLEASAHPEVYESMSASSQEMLMKYSGGSEDVYESMLEIDPECAEDLYEEMAAVGQNPEEAMLRKFFQAKPRAGVDQDHSAPLRGEEEEQADDLDEVDEEEEEDPYKLCPEDIYDTVEVNGSSCNPEILNRPPAPMPRPESTSDLEWPQTYISRDKAESQSRAMETSPAAPPSPLCDPYAGVRTPGQRQLVSLQERVKAGALSVDEAVQQFKAWQLDHERRAGSICYQQENLKRLRDSITRRHRERGGAGAEPGYDISAPLERNLYWSPSAAPETSVYEAAPRAVAPPPLPPTPAHSIHRSSWQTGSTSSTSSAGSSRLSAHGSVGATEPDLEDLLENVPPPRPPRPPDAAAFTSPPFTSPPRIPPRIPERLPEKTLHERYTTGPTRALPQRPAPRLPAPPGAAPPGAAPPGAAPPGAAPPSAAPPVPRRLR
ncbi:Phosphoinositide 3-kinase adapter protein 1 [Liparis tanakae]|uniref:Phosphoinositide 3-kinase adapter protein 1 n=1 Tax=Liparis tanakae TaxID=230148 RepID=A0A4Z2EZZ1_9TELE|nr:Phosphoinositide 3-kinase adapter protein 1 [Liparis tanakae]